MVATILGIRTTHTTHTTRTTRHVRRSTVRSLVTDPTTVLDTVLRVRERRRDPTIT